jgi:N utilization substance protein A
VKRSEGPDLIVDLGRTEGRLPRREQSKLESFSPGDRIRVVIKTIEKAGRGPAVVVSRGSEDLVRRLFEQEVPEIYDSTVEIRVCAREAGERTKIGVLSHDRDVDAVGACVGMKGMRVQSIIRELRGEKIDIIEHSDDLVTFAQSALAPAKITRVSVTHPGEYPHLDVIVEDEQLSLAIGKRGQNVRLASELIGAKIDIKSETDVKDEVADALARMLRTAMADEEETGERPAVAIDLTAAPGIGPKTAEALSAAGYGELSALLAAGEDELTAVEGVGPKTAEALKAWALERAGEQEAAAAAEQEARRIEAPAATPSGMGDEDFMAALSRAFQESEQLRESVAQRTAEEEAAEQAAATAEQTSETAETSETAAAAEAEARKTE